MAPSHLSVREMREDEKPVVLEMLKVRAGRGTLSLGEGDGSVSGFSHLPEPASTPGE